MTVSGETAGYLKQVLELSKASGGAMDPTMGQVIRLWDIDGENPHIPEEEELNSLLENVGYQKVTLDGDKVTMPEGVTLDLGAAEKESDVMRRKRFWKRIRKYPLRSKTWAAAVL